MPKCNSRHTNTTRVPLEQRERHPHRSGQEYEYGETPETGLGGAGVGTDPDKQCAHHSEPAASELAREDQAPTPTRLGGGGSEDQGVTRDRDDKHPPRKGGRRAKFDDDRQPNPDMSGQQGIPERSVHDR